MSAPCSNQSTQTIRYIVVCVIYKSSTKNVTHGMYSLCVHGMYSLCVHVTQYADFTIASFQDLKLRMEKETTKTASLLKNCKSKYLWHTEHHIIINKNKCLNSYLEKDILPVSPQHKHSSIIIITRCPHKTAQCITN